MGVIPCEFESRLGHQIPVGFYPSEAKRRRASPTFGAYPCMLNKNEEKKLIISADDFGISKLANQNILMLARSGKLDRVAVMTNQKFLSQEDVSELKKTKVLLDIHLELPVKNNGKRKLKGGIARRGMLFLFHYILGRNGRRQIKHEWRMQIEKFYEIFRKYPDGINSHEYIHFFPPYFRSVLELAKEYRIKFIRFGKLGPLKKKSQIYKILNRLHKINNRKFKYSHLESTDYFVSLDWVRNFERFFENSPSGDIELICHPERKEEIELINKYF